MRYEEGDVLLLSYYPLPEATFSFEITQIGREEIDEENFPEDSIIEDAA